MTIAQSPAETRADDPWIDALVDAPPGPAPALPSELEAELRDLAPVSPRRPRREFAIVVAASFAYAALLLFVFELRPDLARLPLAWTVMFAAGWTLGFTVPLYISLVPPRAAVMPRWRLGGALAALSSVTFVVTGFLFPRHTAMSHVDRLANADRCLSLGLLTAVVPVALGALWLRGAAPVGTRLTAAALGAAGGGLGGLMLHFHCPISDGVHVGIAHGGVVVCSALLAAATMSRPLVPKSLPTSPERR